MPARMRDFIMTGSPRSRCSLAMTKSTIPSSPLWRGAAQRRGGQRSQDSATSLSLRAIADGAAISSVSLCSIMCRSGAYAPCAYPRICSNCASACFHILFIPSAYACGYPRICSNCAIACFHILGFIASHRRWRGNPVNKTCRAATQYLNFAP